MPYCRNCNSRISKFEKDICPVCGTRNPLDGASSDTVEITSQLDVHGKDAKKMYDPHFRITAFILFSFIGWTGAGYFYLKFKKMGFIWLAANLLVIGGIMAAFLLTLGPKSWLSYAAPFASVYLVNMGIGVYYLAKQNAKDGNGEFIR